MSDILTPKGINMSRSGEARVLGWSADSLDAFTASRWEKPSLSTCEFG